MPTDTNTNTNTNIDAASKLGGIVEALKQFSTSDIGSTVQEEPAHSVQYNEVPINALSYSARAHTDSASVPNGDVYKRLNVNGYNTYGDITQSPIKSEETNDANIAINRARSLNVRDLFDYNDVNPWQDNNFAMQGRYGNLNLKSYPNTLNLSRLADALNNERHWTPTNIGYRTNSQFGTQAAQMGSSDRWQDINTQEMRQMRTNETLDSMNRQADIALQSGINQYKFDLQKRADEITNMLAERTGTADINFRDRFADTLKEVEYSRPSQNSQQTYMQTYMRKLEIEVGADIARQAYEISKLNPTVAQIWSSCLHGAIMPSTADQISSNILQNIVRNSGVTNPVELNALVSYANGIAFVQSLESMMPIYSGMLGSLTKSGDLSNISNTSNSGLYGQR